MDTDTYPSLDDYFNNPHVNISDMMEKVTTKNTCFSLFDHCVVCSAGNEGIPQTGEETSLLCSLSGNSEWL